MALKTPDVSTPCATKLSQNAWQDCPDLIDLDNSPFHNHCLDSSGHNQDNIKETILTDICEICCQKLSSKHASFCEICVCDLLDKFGSAQTPPPSPPHKTCAKCQRDTQNELSCGFCFVEDIIAQLLVLE